MNDRWDVSLFSNRSSSIFFTSAKLSRATFISLLAFFISFEFIKDSIICAVMFVPAPASPKVNPAKRKGEAAPAVINVAIPPPTVRSPPKISTDFPAMCANLCLLHTSSSLSAAARELSTAFFRLEIIFSAFSLNGFRSCGHFSSDRALDKQRTSCSLVSSITILKSKQSGNLIIVSHLTSKRRAFFKKSGEFLSD